jgi:diadenosine tetraphosphate (Ap4A) HIT family hydrolase
VTAGFSLHPRLAEDCLDVAGLDLCRVLMMKDAHYPWFILVPQRPEVTEIYQLGAADRAQLMDESVLLSRCMAELFRPDKLNIAAIGNLVPQLHVHHVGRFRDDPAWPNPVWGRLPALPYEDDAAAGRVEDMRRALARE